MKNKIIVYTAILNNYDDLKDPRIISPNCDYVCFTDNPKLKSKIWTIKKIPFDDKLDPTRINRKIKIMPHLFFPNYKYSIYIDGNIDIIGDLEKIIYKYFILRKNIYVTLKHPKRSCIYSETKICINKKKDDYKNINNQIKKYKKLKFPKNLGLTENGMIVREHNKPLVIKTMEDWWQEIINYSKRDQLSFSFVSWKNKLPYTFLDENIRIEDGFFYKRDHKMKGLKRIKQLIKDNKHKNRFLKFIYITGTKLLGFRK